MFQVVPCLYHKSTGLVPDLAGQSRSSHDANGVVLHRDCRAAEVRSLFPEVEAVRESLVDRSQLFDAVVSLLSQLSSNGKLTVIILDDIQWLDESHNWKITCIS